MQQRLCFAYTAGGIAPATLTANGVVGRPISWDSARPSSNNAPLDTSTSIAGKHRAKVLELQPYAAPLSRNTIRKHLRSDVVQPQLAQRTIVTKLDPFSSKLSGWLRTEANGSRKQRRTIKQMFLDLQTMWTAPRQVNELHIRAAILNRFTELGCSQTEAMA